MSDEEQPTTEEDRPATPEELRELGETLTKKYKMLVEKNQRRLQEVSGKGVAINAEAVLRARLELFIEFILPMNTLQRPQFEIAWQETFAQIIEQAYGDLTRQQLLQGANLRGMPRR